MDADRVEFLFGRAPEGVDLTEIHARSVLLRADRPGAGKCMLALRAVIATQILADDRPTADLVDGAPPAG
jgi:hypothetical protein